MTPRIAVAGITGRMGQEIVAAAADDPTVEIIGGTSRQGGSLVDLLPGADVVVDVTRPEVAVVHAELCAAAGIPFVTGTTGFDPDQTRRLALAAEDIPVFAASNLSPGIAAVMSVLPLLVAALDGFDIEIVETHHRHKADAPSGTALALLGVISGDREEREPYSVVHGRSGQSRRSLGEIGVHAVRAGGNPGEHTIVFADSGEDVRISHRAFSRRPYALGALRAARWLQGRVPGLYGMADLLRAEA